MSDPVADPRTLSWEIIQPFHRLERIKVPSGWLYRTVQAEGVALCFVPGPEPEPEPEPKIITDPAL